ncbi:MAG: GNAT family N-acetyltransferase [Cyanobacteria bacterium CRU_2_1]|nr:GNAT family N-acetyltransferase [Cyanobacteria bacterium RU_5_0]NJR60896.1 GNAT family N-acetyltransferase [Cyanobacteria bacterium CRU_2_1]
MSPQFEYRSLSGFEEVQQLQRISAQCFIVSPSDNEETYFNRIGTDNFRVVQQANRIAGGLALIPMGQWWGGQRVLMTGIASVSVAPEFRGAGAAITLMQKMLKELQSQQVPISVLYPATQRLYRKAGYEQGGLYCRWEILTETIRMKEQPLPICPVTPVESADFQEMYLQKAKQNNGHLDRHSFIWQELFDAKGKEPIYSYVIGSTDRPEGYVIMSQHRTHEGSILRIRDWAILSPTAGRSFWTFIAGHRSQLDKVRWQSAGIDLLSFLLPEQTAKVIKTDRWMLRIVDVGLALEKRGYPTHIETELHLEIEDDLLPENSGKFVLSVANGQGNVAQGGKGDLKLDIRGLVPLYTGLFTPQQLQLMGSLEATETGLAIANQLFAGSSPWLPDFF